MMDNGPKQLQSPDEYICQEFLVTAIEQHTKIYQTVCLFLLL